MPGWSDYPAAAPYYSASPMSAPLLVSDPEELSRKDKARRRFRKNVVMFVLCLAALYVTMQFLMKLPG